MIKANELRVGNYAKDEKTGAALRVSNIGDHVIYDVVDRSLYPLPNGWQAVPIPLTPEILEKAGFVLNCFKQYEIVLPNTYSCEDRLLYFSGDYLYLEATAQRRHNSDLIALWNKDLMNNFYLHQLQNLYFALTGEELNIQL